MSSRILRRDPNQSIEPINWPSLGPVSHAPPASKEKDASDPNHSAQLHAALSRVQGLEARVNELQAEVTRREQQARQAGYREGEAAGTARVEPAIEKFSRAAAELAGCRQRYRKEAEQEVVRLSLAIARRILRRELAVDPDALLGLVKAAIEKIDLRETHAVRVNSQDAPLVTALLQRIGSPAKINVVADNSLERGAAVFETSRGSLDASIETQLEEIGRGFADRLNSQ